MTAATVYDEVFERVGVRGTVCAAPLDGSAEIGTGAGGLLAVRRRGAGVAAGPGRADADHQKLTRNRIAAGSDDRPISAAVGEVAALAVAEPAGS
jgi:hypothetical protein